MFITYGVADVYCHVVTSVIILRVNLPALLRTVAHMALMSE